MSVQDPRYKVSLWPFQREACNAAVNALRRGVRRGIISLPTGGGKTFTAGHLVATLVRHFKQAGNKGAKILWVAHRIELIEQATKAFMRAAPDLSVSHWTAKKKDDSGDVVIAMIGSTRTLKGHFTIVVIDEAHHLAEEDKDGGYDGNMYTKLLKKIRWDYLIGLTATPVRLDGRQLGFDEVMYSIRFLDLVRKHRLARPVYTEVLTEQNYTLQQRGGEYTKKSLRKLDNPVRNGKIADIYVKNKAMYGKTLMFVGGVDHCYHMRDEILKRDPTAQIAVLTGKDKKDYREQVLAWFSQGSPNTPMALINCEIFTEGYDESTINTVVLARPTMSKTLWLQMVGRGARIVMHDSFVRPEDVEDLGPMGDDGIRRFKFSNGAEWNGESLGEIEHPQYGKVLHLRLQMHNEFHLVNIMDDITKFATLCEEWQLDVRDLTEQEIEEIEETKVLRKKVLKIQALKDDKKIDQGVDLGKLDDEKMRDVVAVLVFSTYYNRKVGVPLDVERMNALNRLHNFTRQHCYRQKTIKDPFDPNKEPETVWDFDLDKFKQAYTWCCVTGEFPYRLFEKIRVAYHFKHIMNRERVRFMGDGRLYPTWEVYPLVDIAPESRAKYVEQAKRELEEAKNANEEFNAEYEGSREKIERLMRDILRQAHQAIGEMDEDTKEEKKEKKTSRRALNVVGKTLSPVRAADRRLILSSSMVITKNWEIAQIAKTRDILSEAMQEVLDDPSCTVVVSPREVRLDKTGRSAGSREEQFNAEDNRLNA